MPLVTQPCHILHEALEETEAGGQHVLVREQRGADLYNNLAFLSHNRQSIRLEIFDPDGSYLWCSAQPQIADFFREFDFANLSY